jgi:uncharacterized protein (DUF2336 family)
MDPKMIAQIRSLFAELDASLSGASKARQSAMLRAVTDLLVNGAAYSEAQVAIFDDVLSRLVARSERTDLTELSARLAPLGKAPANVVNLLSGNDDITISGPLLAECEALADAVLVEIAATKSQRHLLTIAGRKHISEPVSDVVIKRGNLEVAQAIVGNMGARFSELGFVKLIHWAKSHATLATALAARKDVPPELQPFLDLACA